ncbi:MAG: exosortase [Desulforhopalus sp.]|jgi:exosortase
MNSKTVTALLGGLSFLLFIVVFYPALDILVTKWFNSDEYTHAFLVLPIICYMVWTKKELLIKSKSSFPIIGISTLLVALLLYYFSLLTEVHTIILLSMFLAIVGILIFLTGFEGVKYLLTPLILLLILIPIPEQLYTLLTFPLQLKVSETSETILRMFHIPMLRQGNIMQIPGMSFEVIEACSGLRSVVSLLTLSILMGSFTVKRLSSKTILFFVSIPLAIFVNIIRVVTMILAYHFFRLDLTEGVWHTVMGLLVFVIAIATLFLLQNILESWECR